jgi:hypothetical protein
VVTGIFELPVHELLPAEHWVTWVSNELHVMLGPQ